MLSRILGSIPGYTNFSEAAKKAEEINNQFGPAPRASLADSEKLRTEFMEFMDRHKAAGRSKFSCLGCLKS
jgi:hypothetical protein